MLINKIDTFTFQIKLSGQKIRVWSDHMSIRICSGPYAHGPNQARIQDFTLGGALLREESGDLGPQQVQGSTLWGDRGQTSLEAHTN